MQTYQINVPAHTQSITDPTHFYLVVDREHDLINI